MIVEEYVMSFYLVVYTDLAFEALDDEVLDMSMVSGLFCLFFAGRLNGSMTHTYFTQFA